MGGGYWRLRSKQVRRTKYFTLGLLVFLGVFCRRWYVGLGSEKVGHAKGLRLLGIIICLRVLL